MSTFYSDGYRDAKDGAPCSPPDVPIYESEYKEGFEQYALDNPTLLSESLYVTEMLRWGDREAHSYVIGAFTSKALAEEAGEVEKTWRGCKYEYEVTLQKVDFIPQKKLSLHKKCLK